MDLVYIEFENEILNLKKHIEFINELKNDIIPLSKNYEYLKSNSRKRIDYNSLIISLYGIVESYIEKFLISFLEVLEKEVLEYSCLNPNITGNHFNLSISLLNKIIENKHTKFFHLKKEDVVFNLSNCLTDKNPYTFNHYAFLINTGNLKHSKVVEILKYIDIDLIQEIKSHEGFGLNTENLFNKIDELVQRRNEIAHGNVNNILDNSEIIVFVDFIQKYLSAIHDILKAKIEIEKLNYFKKKGLKLLNFKIFKGNIIGIVDGVKLNLKINDTVVIEKSDKLKLATLVDLKLFANNDITIKLDENIRIGNNFYINF